MLSLSKLYAILDLACFPELTTEPQRTTRLLHNAEELAAAGVTLMQYRAKNVASREMLSQARELRRVLGDVVKLIMNDRADLCLAAGFDGVHVGPNRVLGLSTHNAQQLREAAATSADYIAIGPVFSTSSKLNPDPVVGIEGIRAARLLTTKPLVAIGGITRANCNDVFAAGANSVAVISDLLRDPRKSALEFLEPQGGPPLR